jgi:hypothetical protein
VAECSSIEEKSLSDQACLDASFDGATSVIAVEYHLHKAFRKLDVK